MLAYTLFSIICFLTCIGAITIVKHVITLITYIVEDKEIKMKKCEHCGEEEGINKLRQVFYARYSALLCDKCIAGVHGAIDDVILEYLHENEV